MRLILRKKTRSLSRFRRSNAFFVGCRSSQKGTLGGSTGGAPSSFAVFLRFNRLNLCSRRKEQTFRLIGKSQTFLAQCREDFLQQRKEHGEYAVRQIVQHIFQFHILFLPDFFEIGKKRRLFSAIRAQRRLSAALFLPLLLAFSTRRESIIARFFRLSTAQCRFFAFLARFFTFRRIFSLRFGFFFSF